MPGLPGAGAPAAAVAAAAAWLPARGAPGTGRAPGDVLQGHRKANGLNQQQLADMLGYDRTYISMIESGRRRAWRSQG